MAWLNRGTGVRRHKPKKQAKKEATWSGPVPASGEEIKMVIVVRSDLAMSPGKVAAQCAHGAVGLVDKLTGKHNSILERWRAGGQTKITLKVKDAASMLALAKEAATRGLPSEIIEDAGRTEVAAGSQTVLAILGGRSKVDEVTGALELYK